MVRAWFLLIYNCSISANSSAVLPPSIFETVESPRPLKASFGRICFLATGIGGGRPASDESELESGGSML